MVTIAKRYINPFTDFGFKKLFGEEENKDLLIDFLNELLKEYGVQIAQLTYLKTEKLGFTEADRRAVYDLYCEDENGEKFIVELQRAKQEHFKDRSIYYATFPIQEQAKKGKWNYELKGVYFVAIMDFVFDDSPANSNDIIHHIQLMNTKTHEVFYDKLHFTYIEIEKFGKELHELHTHFDKWLYVLRNLPSLDEVPDEIVEQVFQKLFKVAEIAKFNARQRQNYRNSEKIYNDFVNSLDTYFKDGYNEGAKLGLEKGLQEGLQKGLEEGLQKGLQEGLEKGLQEGIEKGLQEGIEKGRKEALLVTARNLKSAGVATNLIVQATGLSVEEIEQL
jgi:predicted transposase/invertase (TIGR01784 family)